VGITDAASVRVGRAVGGPMYTYCHRLRTSYAYIGSCLKCFYSLNVVAISLFVVFLELLLKFWS